MKPILATIMIALFASCSSSDDPDTIDDTNPPGGNTPVGVGQPGVVTTTGIAAWDNLTENEKSKIKGWNTIFMHQSVGGDLEDGAANNGFRFEYFDLTVRPDQGLSGNVFIASNGSPMEKINEFKANVLAHKSIVKIAIFKFGYADITDENMDQVKGGYKKMVDDLKKEIPSLRFIHITPPLVYIVTRDDGNAAKIKVGTWMKQTFQAQDVVFDLQEIESNNGACHLNDVWSICNEYRSRESCSSKSQGVDAPEGQGHLCEAAATKISKAFLMSIYQSGK